MASESPRPGIDAPPASIEWVVVDPYRLVVGRGGTEKLNQRFDEYYESVSTQKPYDALDVEWDAKKQEYAADYLNVSTWRVRFKTSLNGVCKWFVAGKALPDRLCSLPLEENVAAGATVGVTSTDGRSLSLTIKPRDVLIASIGDSYASGEGVPDVRARGGQPARWMDLRCHRSLFSGPGLAALFYTRINPHVSVTHLSFACSGAHLRDGLIGAAYHGIVPMPEPRPPRAQIDDLIDALTRGNRVPDFVTISAGGNDLGFGEIVTAAALDERGKLRRLLAQIPDLAAKLVKDSSLLGSAFAEKFPLAPERVLLTEYPNPTNVFIVPDGAQGTEEAMTSACGERTRHLMRFTPALVNWLVTITHAEVEEMNRLVQQPLSLAIDKMATSLSATRVVGIDTEFVGHGFCAPGLHGKANLIRWINTVSDSEHVLGDRDGAMHPNIRGQASLGRQILEHLRRVECTSEGLDTSVRTQLRTGDAWKHSIKGYVAMPQTDDVSHIGE